MKKNLTSSSLFVAIVFLQSCGGSPTSSVTNQSENTSTASNNSGITKVIPTEGDVFTYIEVGTFGMQSVPRPYRKIQSDVYGPDPSGSGFTITSYDTGAEFQGTRIEYRTLSGGLSRTEWGSSKEASGNLNVHKKCSAEPVLNGVAAPLSIGKTWSNTSLMDCRERTYVGWTNSEFHSLNNQGKIESIEEIEITSGKFRTIKEVFTISDLFVNSSVGNMPDKTNYVCWRDIELGIYVRCDIESTVGLLNAAATQPASNQKIEIKVRKDLVGFVSKKNRSVLSTVRFAGNWSMKLDSVSYGLPLTIKENGTFQFSYSDLTNKSHSMLGQIDVDGVVQIREDLANSSFYVAGRAADITNINLQWTGSDKQLRKLVLSR